MRLHSGLPGLRSVCLLLLLALALPAAQAQDAIDALTDALELTDAQVEIVEDVYRPGDPGVGWTLAAELGPTLTDAQRARLLTPPERSGERARPGGREQAGGRGQGRRGARGGRSQADRAVARAARDAALGLDAEQSAALDAAFEAGRGERGADPVTRAVAELLDETQQDLVRLQRGLTRMLVRSGAAGRRGGSRG